MIQNYQPTAAELRILRADAARVREQNERRPLRRLTWTPPTVEPLAGEHVEDERVAS